MHSPSYNVKVFWNYKNGLLHAIFDFCGKIQEISINGGIVASEITKASTTLTDVAAVIVITLPLLIYGLIILRKVTPKNVFEPLKMNLLTEEGMMNSYNAVENI
jgi:hypothetical protein